MEDKLKLVLLGMPTQLAVEVSRQIGEAGGGGQALTVAERAETKADAATVLANEAIAEVSAIDVPALEAAIAETEASAAALSGSVDKINGLLPYGETTEIDVLIVYGQSNARGYAATSAGDPVYKAPSARVWDGSAFIALTSYTPTSGDGTSTGSAWAAFGNEYCKLTGRKLVIVNGGKGSQSVAELQKGGAVYTALAGWVTGAKSAIVAEGNTVGKVLVAYSQGERDSQLKTTPSVYNASLATLWADMKADFAATHFGIFTVGYYADANLLWGQAIQQAQRLYARGTSDVFIAYDNLGAFGSHNGLKVDSVHYNQRGYNIMGREGAQRFAELVFPDTDAPQTDQLIERFGRLNMNQSQSWNLHAGILQKQSSEPGWNVNHTSPRSHSLITDIDATTSDTILNVRLACPARAIMCFNAEFGGVLKIANVRAVIGSGLAATGTWPTPTSDGMTVVPVTFFADIAIRVDMAAATIDNQTMGTALASLLDGVSATFPAVGQVSLTHGTAIGFPHATIDGPTGRFLQVDAAANQTVIYLKDFANAPVNDTVHLTLRNVAIKHIDLPTSSELSFQMIAADYAVW